MSPQIQHQYIQPAPTPLEQPLVRQGIKLVLDGSLAYFSWFFCARIFSGGQFSRHGAVKWTFLALGVNLAFQLTRQHYRLIGFRDALRVALATASLLGLSTIFAFLGSEAQTGFVMDTGISAALTTGGLWMIFRGVHRAFFELSHDRREHLPEGSVVHPTLIVGAGRAGVMIATELKRHPELGTKIVGFVDDALDKQGIRIQGTRVLGPSGMLKALIKEHHITRVVLAIPSATGSVIRSLANTIQDTGAEVKTVPGLFNLLGSRTWKPVLKDISIDDLLRREPVQLDQGALSQVLEDAIVLITGGGGSIGGELARQVAAFRPARIVLLGRGENSLWTVERNLRAEFPNQSLALELCDIRNTTRLQQVFDRWHPQVVFHAAAHKHVPYLDAHPEEAVGNNIFGTLNVLQAATKVGTHSFVNISTDKAINPTNVLGATKRIAESLVVRAARLAPGGSRYVCVRFGNVLGSRGSVIPVFQEQIRSGGPITVTHPDMTRYFMTIPEASQLVLQAGMLGDTGKVYVLDMGDPVKIVDLAKDMARLNGLTPDRDIDIQFTGIRPGEKLYEELFSPQENSSSEVHPKVFNAQPESLNEAFLEEGLAALKAAAKGKEGVRQTQILNWLMRMVPSYSPSPTGLGRYGEAARATRSSGAHPLYVPGPH